MPRSVRTPARASLRTPAVALVLAGVTALGLTACSSGSGSKNASSTGSSSPSASASSTTSVANGAALVSQASSATGQITSAHIAVTSTISGKHITFNGDVRYKPTLAMKIDFKQGTQDFQEVLTGSTLYVKVPGGAQGKPWGSVSIGKATASLGIDLNQLIQNSSPAHQLALLEKDNAIKVVGHTTVNGEDTTHLSGSIDLAKFYTQLTGSTKTAYTDLVKSQGVKNIKLDVYVDSRNIPVKVDQSYDSNDGPVSFTMLLTDINGKVSVSPPPASQVAKLF